MTINRYVSSRKARIAGGLNTYVMQDRSNRPTIRFGDHMPKDRHAQTVSAAKHGIRSSCAKLSNSFHKFYFIKPVPGNNADSLVKMLLNLERIEEVYITEGDYGLVVRARASDTEGDDTVGDYIADKLNERFNSAVSYYKYRK